MLGWLFKSVSKAGEKTNMYVFLTPRVVKSPLAAKELYQEKKEQFDSLEKGQIKLYDRNTDGSKIEPKSQ